LPAAPLSLALVIALAGWHGRREDQPFLDLAVIVPRARKLTPDLVTRAFIAAGLCKEDNPITFPQPICRDGDGWLALVDLPYGKKAADALKKQQDIAAALDIDEVQVFLDRIRGEAGSARRVALWVADVDVFARKPPVTALAKADQVDFWKGFRFGQDAANGRFNWSWSGLRCWSGPFPGWARPSPPGSRRRPPRWMRGCSCSSSTARAARTGSRSSWSPTATAPVPARPWSSTWYTCCASWSRT
jgi:hypothetical protein